MVESLRGGWRVLFGLLSETTCVLQSGSSLCDGSQVLLALVFVDLKTIENGS